MTSGSSLPEAQLDCIVTLRRALHRTPELSNRENGTARTIAEFVGGFDPDEIVTGLGGAGIAAVYRGSSPGPTVLIRSELDALPIAELNEFAHRSVHADVSHKCGHDGHMAMVAGLAPLLMRSPPARGRVVLLFQPAEETGEGAAAVLRDPRFAALRPDFAFAIHNIPGRPLREVIVREGTFTMASVGVSIELIGRTSHASEPELGVSPSRALAQLMHRLPQLATENGYDGFTLVTLTHARLGERSYGISPGRAEVLATLRAERDLDLERLRSRASALAAEAGREYGLHANVGFSDHFAASVNDAHAVSIVRAAAADAQLDVHTMPAPIRWSEDFGLFTQVCKGALIGLGSGIDQPALHAPDYDFPDAALSAGIHLFDGILRRVMAESTSP
jgi:amidohydrolase